MKIVRFFQKRQQADIVNPCQFRCSKWNVHFMTRGIILASHTPIARKSPCKYGDQPDSNSRSKLEFHLTLVLWNPVVFGIYQYSRFIWRAPSEECWHYPVLYSNAPCMQICYKCEYSVWIFQRNRCYIAWSRKIIMIHPRFCEALP